MMNATASHVTRLDVEQAQVEYRIAADGVPERNRGYPLCGTRATTDPLISIEEFKRAVEGDSTLVARRAKEDTNHLVLTAGLADTSQDSPQRTVVFKVTPFSVRVVLTQSAEIDAHLSPLRRLFETLNLEPQRPEQ